MSEPTILHPSAAQVLRNEREHLIGRAETQLIGPGLETDQLRIYAVHFEPGARFRPHRHGFDQVLYFQYGTGVVAVDGGEDVIVPEGSFVMLPANHYHMHGCTDDGPALQISVMRDSGGSEFAGSECPESWRSYLDRSVGDAQVSES